MSNTSQNRKRTNSRITYAATAEGIERAEQALRRVGAESKEVFAKCCGLSRSTITKFFSGGSIELDGFQIICGQLELSDWREIAGIKSTENNGKVKPELNSFNQTTEDKKVPFSVIGTVNKKDIAKLKSAIQLLRKLTGDDLIDVIDIEEGSIKLTLKGSTAGLKRLEKLFRSGKLNQTFEQEFNITVENVRFINPRSSAVDLKNEPTTTEDTQLAFTIAGDVSQADIDILKTALIDTSDDDEEIENEEKSRLIEEIKNRGAKGRNLNKADLGGADLSNASLRGAKLIFAKLNNANLRGADLSGANLSGANLSGAKLSYIRIDEKTKLDSKWRKVWEIINQGAKGQDLSGVDLSNANLSGADLNNARLVQVNLIHSQLNNANLIGANLIGADLRNAELLETDLTDADLSGAKVENARFGYNLGISESLKRDLIDRKAIFEDTPGDYSEVYSPTPTRV